MSKDDVELLILLQPRPGKKMLIKVKTLTGKEIEIDIEPTDKVEPMKELVQEKKGVPPPPHNSNSSKQMNDEKTAADYNILSGSILHLVLALRGGGGLRQ